MFSSQRSTPPQDVHTLIEATLEDKEEHENSKCLKAKKWVYGIVSSGVCFVGVFMFTWLVMVVQSLLYHLALEGKMVHDSLVLHIGLHCENFNRKKHCVQESRSIFSHVFGCSALSAPKPPITFKHLLFYSYEGVLPALWKELQG